jgi:hypothetical protein
MNAVAEGIKLVPGQLYGGGIFSHLYMHGIQRRALILAPNAGGLFRDVRWHKDWVDVPGALSFYDGLANTSAMFEAGSELAIGIRALRLGGFQDWCLPAIDQLEPVYRIFKPGTAKNYCWARSGINLSAIPPSWPYTPDSPVQTEIEGFRLGEAEAFEEGWYWTSTQHPGGRGYAWMQYFSDGYQLYFSKGYSCLARAVRSESI